MKKIRFHHQANGQLEKANQEISCFLRTYCANKQEDWAQFLPWVEYAQNSLRRLATKLTPFQCVLTYKPPLLPIPMDLPTVDRWLKQSEQVWKQAHQHLEHTTQVSQKFTDRCRGETPIYEPGNQVWLSTSDLHITKGCGKLAHYIGQFKNLQTLQHIKDITYKLKLPCHSHLSLCFLCSLLCF